jgi:hypothetical protein
MGFFDKLVRSFETLGAEIHAVGGDVARGEAFPNAIYVPGGWDNYREAEDVLRQYGIDTWGQYELSDSFQFSANRKANDVVKILKRHGIDAWRG